MSALWPLPRWRSARPDPHKGAGLVGHFAPEAFGTPIDRQATFLSALAAHYTRRSLCLTRVSMCLRPPLLAWAYSFARGAATPRRFVPSSPPVRRPRHWNGCGQEASQPQPDCRVAFCQRGHGGSCLFDQHLAQISAFHQFRLTASSGLARHKPQPCGEVAPLLERRRVTDRSDQRSRVQRSHAGNACQAPRPLVGLGHIRKLSVKGSDAAVQFVQRARMSPRRNAMRRLNSLPPESRKSPSKWRRRARPSATMYPRYKGSESNWSKRCVRQPGGRALGVASERRVAPRF